MILPSPSRLAAAFTLVCFAAIATESGAVESAFLIEGFSQPNRVAQVAAPTAGIIAQRLVNEGAFVREGDCLCQLDNGVYEKLLLVAATAQEAVGEINAATAELKDAAIRLEAVRGLSHRAHSSINELRRIETEHELAAAHLQVALESKRMRQAEYEKLLAQASDYRLVSPFDGVVVEFHKECGEYVGPANPGVCTVAELKVLSVDFLLPRAYRSQFTTGQSVQIQFTETDQRVPGLVYYISPYPDGETNTYTLKIRVDNAEGNLSAGERCQLDTVPTTQVSRSATPPTKLIAHDVGK